MNKVTLLTSLGEFTRGAVAELIMPVSLQKGDTEQQHRAAEVYLARLPDSKSAKKKAPYILHQIVTGKDVFPAGTRPEASAVVRSVFCVYNDNEEEGGLMLLNLIERVRIAILKQGVIGKQFRLDLDAGLEMLVYPDDTAPYYIGEMLSVWKLPPIEREVPYGKEGHGNIRHPGPGAACERTGVCGKYIPPGNE